MFFSNGFLLYIFEVFGTPKPQKQTQFSRKGAYDPSFRDKKQIIWQIKPYAPKEPLLGAVSVDILFIMPMPVFVSKTKKKQMLDQEVYPHKRPDLDNMGYLVTNAMKELVYKDDSQIVDLTMRKRYGEQPKIVIKVKSI